MQDHDVGEFELKPPLGNFELCAAADRPFVLDLCEMVSKLHAFPDKDVPRDWELSRPTTDDLSLTLNVYGFMRPITEQDFEAIKRFSTRVLQPSLNFNVARNGHRGALRIVFSTLKGEMHAQSDASGATDFAIRRLKAQGQRDAEIDMLPPLASVGMKRERESAQPAAKRTAQSAAPAQPESATSLFSKIADFLLGSD